MYKPFSIKNLNYYVSKDSFATGKTPVRTVKNYEIELYATSGSISIINGQKYLQKAGNILISQPGDLRCSVDAYECYCIHFYCENSAIVNTICQLPTVIRCRNTEKFIQLFKTMLEVRNKKTIASNLIIYGALNELIGQLSLENENSYTGKYTRYISDISASCVFMQKNLEHHITLKDISGSVNLSPSFFHTVFKSVKGYTPTEYLLNQRIILAKKMLRRSNTPISEIAVLCGFGSQGYFCRTFKKHTGTTPKKYRDDLAAVFDADFLNIR